MQISNLGRLVPLFVLIGCSPGGPTLTPVRGTITLAEKPLAEATVRYIPVDDTLGHGGTGRTGVDGKYEIIANRQNDRKGLLPGTYRVVVTTVPPFAKPIESDVKELVPEPYCNVRESPLRATVEAFAKEFDFAIKK